jgi:magnesium-transporting ATPase (P-type)
VPVYSAFTNGYNVRYNESLVTGESSLVIKHAVASIFGSFIGLTVTEVAKEASDIVLIDDNFS